MVASESDVWDGGEPQLCLWDQQETLGVCSGEGVFCAWICAWDYDRERSIEVKGKKKEFWDKKNPNKKSKSLTPEQKKAAMARAKEAGRKYPNLVDNSWASRRG